MKKKVKGGMQVKLRRKKKLIEIQGNRLDATFSIKKGD